MARAFVPLICSIQGRCLPALARRGRRSAFGDAAAGSMERDDQTLFHISTSGAENPVRKVLKCLA